MRKLFVLAAAFMMLLIGCGREEEPVRQLFFPEYTVLGETVTAPAWFYPEDGTVEFLCPGCEHQYMDSEYAFEEDAHGEECLFYKFSGSEYSSLVGDRLYYFLAEDLYVYDTVSGERERLKDMAASGYGEYSYILKGEYLYRYDRDSAWENGLGYDKIERIHLPDMRVEDISGQRIPWKIADGVGYYSMADSSPYRISGLYSQPLYTSGETPPAKKLLLHEIDLGVFPLLTEDAVYWTGDNMLREVPDTVVSNLYRYDLEKQSTILVAEDFGRSRIVAVGEELYAVRPAEDGYALVCVSRYGIVTVPGRTEAGQRLVSGSVDTAGQYVIADIVSDGEAESTKTGKMVYDTEAGEVKVYWLREITG